MILKRRLVILTLIILTGVCILMTIDYRIGELAEKYETSNRGPGYISSGESWGDPGGTSYGSYQLETKKGTMQEYLQGDDKFINALKRFKVNTQEFKAKWRELAATDPEGFEQSQFNYLANKPGGYNDGYKWAKANGWAADNFAMQSAIYSAVNQSGGWRRYFSKAGINPKDDVVTQINKLYDARAAYFRSLSLKYHVKKNIILQRTDQNMDGSRSKLNTERDDCLKLI
jgi:hypothetical protein